MHNPAPVQENDTHKLLWTYGLVPHLSKKLSKFPHKLLWDFDIYTDHLISARRSDLIIINKK